MVHAGKWYVWAGVLLIAGGLVWTIRSLRASPDTAGTDVLLLDPMQDTRKWEAMGPNGERAPSLTLDVLAEHPHDSEGKCLRLRADFQKLTGEYAAIAGSVRVPGRECLSLALWVKSDGSGCPLSVVIEDSRHRWYERVLGRLSWTGWQEITAPVGQGEGWTPLLRQGEEAEPICHPIAVRQIRLYRPSGTGPVGLVTACLAELRGVLAATGVGALTAQVTTGLPGNTLWGDQALHLRIRLTNASSRVVNGSGQLRLTSLLGSGTTVPLPSVSVPPRGHVDLEAAPRLPLYGSYDVQFTFRTPGSSRYWHTIITRVRATPLRSGGHGNPFGCSGNIGVFPATLAQQARRLNSVAGIAWTRLGLSWEQVNPLPGVWVWDAPILIPGSAGAALRTGGRAYVSDRPLPRELADEITIAFWARTNRPGVRTVWPVVCETRETGRMCGTYLQCSTGSFGFSAVYERMPGVIQAFDAGESVWDGQWHHYAATYSRFIKQVCLYVDGIARTTAVHDGGAIRLPSTPPRLGSGGSLDLDDVLLYRRALGPADIASLARRNTPPRDGLVTAWDFDSRSAPMRSATDGAVLAVREPDGIRWATEARSRGQRVLGILGFPPDWAVHSAEGGVIPDPAAWSAYVEHVARQYRPLISDWEIWHEPNNEAFWPEPNPGKYLTALQAAYRAAKRGNPQCNVVMPGLAGPDENGSGMEYLARLLALGASRYCDAISVHPTRNAIPERSGFVRQLQRIAALAAANGRRRPIWITEMTWSTEPVSGVSERKQAALLARTWILALGTGVVDRLFWFRFHDSGPDGLVPEENSGLCRHDLSPKPSFLAHRTLAVLLRDSKPLAAIKLSSDVYVCSFRSGSERLAAVWSISTPKALALATGRPEIQVTDLMGNSSLRKTDEGILLLEADDLPVFVRYLRPSARWLEPPLTLPDKEATRGGTVKATLRLRNPFRSTRRVRLTISADQPLLRIRPSAAEVALPPEGTSLLHLELGALASAPIGSTTLRVHATYERMGTPLRDATAASKVATSSRISIR